MGQATTDRLSGLSTGNARGALLGAAALAIAAVALVLTVTGVAAGEVVATLLFLPVFAAGLLAGRTAGYGAAAVATAVYVVLRRGDLSGAGLASAGVLTLTRAGAYVVAGHVGALARALVGAGDGASRPRPQARRAAPARAHRPPTVAWDEPWEAERSQARAHDDRTRPVLVGVGPSAPGASFVGGEDSYGDGPMTMSGGWPPDPPREQAPDEHAGAHGGGWRDPAGRGWPDGADGWPADTRAAADDDWEAVQTSWRRQNGLPAEDETANGASPHRRGGRHDDWGDPEASAAPDPWGPPAAAPPSDPWGTPPAHSAGPPSDPWGTPANGAGHSDPWGTPPAHSAGPPSDPWGNPDERSGASFRSVGHAAGPQRRARDRPVGHTPRACGTAHARPVGCRPRRCPGLGCGAGARGRRGTVERPERRRLGRTGRRPDGSAVGRPGRHPVDRRPVGPAHRPAQRCRPRGSRMVRGRRRAGQPARSARRPASARTGHPARGRPRDGPVDGKVPPRPAVGGAGPQPPIGPPVLARARAGARRPARPAAVPPAGDTAARAGLPVRRRRGGRSPRARARRRTALVRGDPARHRPVGGPGARAAPAPGHRRLPVEPRAAAARTSRARR